MTVLWRRRRSKVHSSLIWFLYFSVLHSVIFFHSLGIEYRGKNMIIIPRRCLWCCHDAQIHCENSTGSFDECRLSARWLPTLRPSQLTLAVIPPVVCCSPHPPSSFAIITQPADTHFTVPRSVEDWVNLGTAVQNSAEKFNDCHNTGITVDSTLFVGSELYRVGQKVIYHHSSVKS